MIMKPVDFAIIGLFLAIVIIIGIIASKTAKKSTAQFFLGGRTMPWWLLGVSMVACTFSADTPNLVTDMVRQAGVAKNWAWWAFLITGMVTVFIYAKLWRRSSVMTDLEFYEIRYSGRGASFLRIFRSLYLGVLFNCLIMGTVSLAAIKIGAVMFGLSPLTTVVMASVCVVIYSALGGLKGIMWADFFQYSIAMFGAVFAAVIAVRQPEIGGLSGLLSNPALTGKLTFFPDLGNPSVYIALLIIPIAVQWWSVWYPGAEPGGGGYIAQRMLSAKNEKHAIGGTLFFNFAHYALRPWPWILVALASLIIYPDLAAIKAEFPNIADQYLRHDIAYPAMLTKLGTGWLGLVIASLIAAYMSTIGTHLNWGSSYVVNDFYKRVMRPGASEKELVLIGRITTVSLMVLAAVIAISVLNNAAQAFNFIILSGAGTGAIYLLRWFWWRINAWTEIVGMVTATVFAVIFIFFVGDDAVATGLLDGFTVKLLVTVVATSIAWIIAMFVTRPVDSAVLREFYRKTKPGGPGWKKVVEEAKAAGDPIESDDRVWEMPLQILCVFIGCVTIYSALFAIGSFVYTHVLIGIVLSVITVLGTIFLFKSFTKLKAA
ncbi:Na+:solute symporter [bacterium]|nr:Na+:solute symporter [bacterium]